MCCLWISFVAGVVAGFLLHKVRMEIIQRGCMVCLCSTKLPMSTRGLYCVNNRAIYKSVRTHDPHGVLKESGKRVQKN